MSSLEKCPDCEVPIGQYHIPNCSLDRQEKFLGHANADITAINQLFYGDDPTSGTTDRDYEPLRAVLHMAYEQAAYGKGKERHANQLPFDEQPILEISRMVGLGGPLFQAMKKSQEAAGMHKRGLNDAAINELLGGIVYLAAGVVLLQSEK